MESAFEKIAEVTLKLKRHYQSLLGASPAYGVEKRMTKEMDTLGQLIKELEDSVIVLQIRLGDQKQQEIHEPESAPPVKPA